MYMPNYCCMYEQIFVHIAQRYNGIFTFYLKKHFNHLRQVCDMLRKEKLYVNPKKSAFLAIQVHLLGFAVSIDGVSTDSEKIRAIAEWPEPTNIPKVSNFHKLAAFYCRFIKGFSTIMVTVLKIGRYIKNIAQFPIFQLNLYDIHE